MMDYTLVDMFLAFGSGFAVSLLFLLWGVLRLVRNFRECLEDTAGIFVRVTDSHKVAINNLSTEVNKLAKKVQPPDDSGEEWKNG